MIQLLKKLFGKKQRKPDGKITMEYDSKTGDIYIISDINDLSDNSALVLALLIYNLYHASLTPSVYESLILWAEGDDERVKFYNEVNRVLNELTEQESKKQKDSGQQPAEVSPLDVFKHN